MKTIRDIASSLDVAIALPLALLLLYLACLIGAPESAHAQADLRKLVSMGSAVDVTGTGAAVKMFPAGGSARAFVIIADPENGSPLRCGDANVGVARGARIAPGGGLMWPALSVDSRAPPQQYFYDLSTVYCHMAIGDKASVAYAQ